MQKDIVDSQLKDKANVLHQLVVIPKNKSSEESYFTEEQKKRYPLMSDDTLAFETVYQQNCQFLRSRLNENISITNKQLNKSVISCPNLVLNSFSLANPDALSLAIVMLSQVYTEVEEYADGLTKIIRRLGKDHEKSITALKNNPVEKNWFFLPYSLVRTLLNSDSIGDSYEPTRFARAIHDIRYFNIPMFYSRNVKKPGEQLELITTLVGKNIALDVSVENILGFENVFYWLDSNTKEEYLAFTISPEFRNLLLLCVEYASQANERFAKILPYSKIDWQYLHYLPNRNSIRQMYLFIKSNMVNFGKIKYIAQSFEYSIDELRKIMGINETSHYFSNDSHFVRDKIRKVITELSNERGFEYDIKIETRNIQTPGGRKEKRVKFTVELNLYFNRNMKETLAFISSLGLSSFNNDALILSCLRYCSAGTLNTHIKTAYDKFMGLMKVQSKKDKEEYTDFTADSQICRFISSELTKFWQSLANQMFIKNSHSRLHRDISEVAEKKTNSDKHIITSSPVLALQKKGRGRPRKTVESSKKLDGVKLSKDEQKIYDELEEQIKLKHKKEVEANKSQDETNQDHSQVSDQGAVDAEQVNLAPDDNINFDDNLLVKPTNFNLGPSTPNSPIENIWDGYSDQDIPEPMDFTLDDQIGTFSINTDNLKSFLIPINGRTDHYAFVDDYLEHIANHQNSEAQQTFYSVFSLSNILNMCEQGNPDLINRSLIHIDLYKEKLNIVLQTLNVCFGTSVQRNDLTSYQSFALEIAVEHFSMNAIALANGERIFTQKFFVQLADKVKNEKKLPPLKALFLCGQCVAYPFT